jgi:hypothetical protein
MTTMGDLVAEVRSMIMGSMPNEISTLADGFNPGDSTISLTYPKKNLNAGAMLCVGLNTFQVLAADSAGQTISIYAGADGGPIEVAPQGALVQIKPRYTDWSIFREINGEIVTMSSPASGLYSVASFTSPPDWVNGTYTLPVAWTAIPQRLLRARYQRLGTDYFQTIRNAEWQPETQQIRVYGPQPGAAQLEFTLAFPFSTADSLATDATTLGLSTFTQDIPGLGAAANLLRATEGRRQQVFSQGDPRRPDEISPGANIGLSREFARIQSERISQEATRLLTQYGYRMSLGV